MISRECATALEHAGLAWDPKPGDVFGLKAELLHGETYVISDMTIERRDFPEPIGTVLGFNGTTEWALDSVQKDEALWFPCEDQLRELLRGTFRSLERLRDGRTKVTTARTGADGRPIVATFESENTAEAYGHALLDLINASRS